MLDNVELIMYMKFQKMLMTRCKYMEKIKNAPKTFSSSFETPSDFFQKSDSVTFVPLWCPNSMLKIRKNNGQLWAIQKQTDQEQWTNRRTNRQRWLHKTPSDKINGEYLRNTKTDGRTDGPMFRRKTTKQDFLGWHELFV